MNNIKVKLFSTKNALEFEKVENFYYKGGLFCMKIKNKVKKIPLSNIVGIFSSDKEFLDIKKVEKNKTVTVRLINNSSSSTFTNVKECIQTDFVYTIINDKGLASIPLINIFDIEEDY